MLRLTRRDQPTALPAVESHPNKALLERFMLGDLPRSGAARIVRHLLTGCTQCREITRQLWGPEDKALERVFLSEKHIPFTLENQE
jgi:hypothetical protein